MKQFLLKSVLFSFIFFSFGIVAFLVIKARNSSSSGLPMDTSSPSALYVNSNETLTAAKRNALIEKISRNTPTDLKTTTTSHNGNFGGTKGIYDWIQNNGCAGYHVCNNTELIGRAQKGNTLPNNAWYYGGTFTFNTSGIGPRNTRDCMGWTTSDSTTEGGFISHSTTFINRSFCGVAHPVACCK